MRHALLLATAAAIAAVAAPASAALMVLGTGDARECYIAAEYKSAPRASIATCDRALDGALSRRDRTATLVNRGIVKMWASDNAAALADFDQALAERPGQPEAMVNKAVALVRMQGVPAEAIALLDRAIAADVSRPEVAFYARGLAHELAGDLPAAYRDYRRAVTLKPDWADPARQLARFTVVKGSA